MSTNIGNQDISSNRPKSGRSPKRGGAIQSISSILPQLGIPSTQENHGKKSIVDNSVDNSSQKNHNNTHQRTKTSRKTSSRQYDPDWTILQNDFNKFWIDSVWRRGERQYVLDLFKLLRQQSNRQKKYFSSMMICTGKLAKKMQCSEKTVIKYLDILHEAGFIEYAKGVNIYERPLIKFNRRQRNETYPPMNRRELKDKRQGAKTMRETQYVSRLKFAASLPLWMRLFVEVKVYHKKYLRYSDRTMYEHQFWPDKFTEWIYKDIVRRKFVEILPEYREGYKRYLREIGKSPPAFGKYDSESNLELLKKLRKKY